MSARTAWEDVVTVSKLCNLRCAYCYEMKELDQRLVLSHDQLKRIYLNILDYYVERDRADGHRTKIKFIWHGGEPLLVPPDFYWTTFEHQRDIFSTKLTVQNVAQTNLTVLDDSRAELLQHGFSSFGVSIDLFGGLRVNLAGKDQQERVLRNMETLRRRGLNFGGLTVLTKKNLAHVTRIFRFYERAQMSFRVLPLFPGAFDDQHHGYEITTSDIISAYKSLLDLWFQSSNPPDILPLTRYIKEAWNGRAARMEPRYFSKREWNPAFLINITGDLFHTADPYGDPDAVTPFSHETIRSADYVEWIVKGEVR